MNRIFADARHARSNLFAGESRVAHAGCMDSSRRVALATRGRLDYVPDNLAIVVSTGGGGVPCPDAIRCIGRSSEPEAPTGSADGTPALYKPMGISLRIPGREVVRDRHRASRAHDRVASAGIVHARSGEYIWPATITLAGVLPLATRPSQTPPAPRHSLACRPNQSIST